jgi:hypothetical protein
MVAEMRALHIDVDSRRHFTPEKSVIADARSVIEDWLAPAAEPYIDAELRSAHSATALSQAADTGFIEVG